MYYVNILKIQINNNRIIYFSVIQNTCVFLILYCGFRILYLKRGIFKSLNFLVKKYSFDI